MGSLLFYDLIMSTLERLINITEEHWHYFVRAARKALFPDLAVVILRDPIF